MVRDQLEIKLCEAIALQKDSSKQLYIENKNKYRQEVKITSLLREIR